MEWGGIWPVVGILVGSGGFLTVSLQEFRKWRSGAAEKERRTNKTMKQQLDDAVALRDWSDERRRIVAEKAAKWRRIAIENGTTETELGPWPDLPARPNLND